MKVNCKALGGLFEFKYYTGGDVNDLTDEELDILREEVNRLQEEIEARSPKKKDDSKHQISKDILSDDEIPYEVRMKYIIDAYRKDKVKWGKLVEYAKHLEVEVIRLKEILIENGYTDNSVIGDYEPSKEREVIRELRAQVNQLKNENKELKKKTNSVDVTALESMISTFPLKIYKGLSFKSIIESQKDYINELQEILDKNDIPYAPQEPVNSLERDGVDEIMEDAGKYLKMHKETIGKIIEKWESM